jgi:CheY-like chemotaxis protein
LPKEPKAKEPNAEDTVTEAGPAQPVRILLVEDDPGDVMITTEALDRSDVAHEVHTVSDGEAALDFLNRRGDYDRARRPDLVLLDLNLPRIDGRDVLAAAKGDPLLRSIPIVVFSTSESDDDVSASYDLHANAYVSKPVDFDAFVRAVRQIDDFFVSLAQLPGGEA